MSSLALPQFDVSRGFARDKRFDGYTPVAPAVPADDPLAAAYASGYADGQNAAAESAAQIQAEADAARSRLELNFAKLDAEQSEVLRNRLYETVAVLCEASLAPLALDTAGLTARVERAVAMLARSDDDRVIRLHPDDLDLVAARLPKDWTVTPDPALDRGALRIETNNGGVEDGPATWRRALSEALRGC